MSFEPKRRSFSRIAIILLLLGIFIELFVIVGILLDTPDRTGNVGVVVVEGPISQSGPAIKALKNFEENDKVKAVVVRVDSPGGTVAASQEIHDEVLRIREKKPVVVSMGDVAASGGYYIAAAASRVVANPGTVTGSIGVIATYFVVDDLLKKLHLKWEIIQGGQMKDLGSPLRMLTPEEREIMRAMTNDIHQQFVSAVADGRKMSVDQVATLADGRVFSGRQAKELGLVDDLGSLEFAIRSSGQLAGIAPGDLKPIYPRPERFGWLERLSTRFLGQSPSSVLDVRYSM